MTYAELKDLQQSHKDVICKHTIEAILNLTEGKSIKFIDETDYHPDNDNRSYVIDEINGYDDLIAVSIEGNMLTTLEFFNDNISHLNIQYIHNDDMLLNILRILETKLNNQ